MSTLLIKKLLFGRKRKLKAGHLLSLIGIIIGVVALLVVSSVMNGLRDDMVQRITGTKAEIHIYSEHSDSQQDLDTIIPLIAEIDKVKEVSPVIRNELLIQKGEQIAIVEAFGIDKDKHLDLSDLDNQIKIGSLQDFENKDDAIIIGLDMSFAIGATVGEYVRVSSPFKRDPTPFGMLPRTKELRVAGIFSSGMPQYDKGYAYMPIEAGRFFSPHADAFDLLQVKIDNPYRSQSVAAEIRNILGNGYIVEDWSMFDRSLFEAMRLEKIVMMTVLTLMIIISGFNMACSSIRMVSEKQKEIGVLQAIGMKQHRISRSFLAANMSIGIAGTVLGVIVAALFIGIQSKYRLISIPIPGFPMQWLPVSFSSGDFFIVILIVMAITYIASLIPLKKIKNMQPVEVLREIL